MSAKVFLDTNVVLCSAGSRATIVLPLYSSQGGTATILPWRTRLAYN